MPPNNGASSVSSRRSTPDAPTIRMPTLFGRPRNLAGRRAILTGASSGIGRSLALQLASNGVRQVLVARSREKLEAVCAEIIESGGEALAVVGDVTDRATRDAALQRVESEWGGLDLLINNAGVGAYGRFAEVSPDRLRTLMEVNLFAAAELLREATPLLRSGEDSVVVNMGSILGCLGLPFSSEYCASKFALHGLSDAIRPELKRIGIDLLLVAPGTTSTEFAENVVDAHGEPPWTRHGGVSPEYVASKTIRALKKRRTFVVPNRQGWWLLLANRLAPGLVDRVLARYG